MAQPVSPESEGADAALLLAEVARLAGDSATLAVAFSGGADSALVLAAAVKALGPGRVLAVTAVSDAVDPGELSAAAAFAQTWGVAHLTPASEELQRPGYVENSPQRCFHCKTEVISVVFSATRQFLDSDGPVVVATGTNADDLASPFRPGIAAAARLGACTPLASLTKGQVREISRTWGLSTAEKPAAPCLASRIAYGVPVLPAALGRVRRAEASLRALAAERNWDLRDLRVRDRGDDHASVEVDPGSVPRWTAEPEVAARVLAAGFTRVDIDPKGFRSGSLNEVLVTAATQSEAK